MRNSRCFLAGLIILGSFACSNDSSSDSDAGLVSPRGFDAAVEPAEDAGVLTPEVLDSGMDAGVEVDAFDAGPPDSGSIVDALDASAGSGMFDGSFIDGSVTEWLTYRCERACAVAEEGMTYGCTYRFSTRSECEALCIADGRPWAAFFSLDDEMCEDRYIGPPEEIPCGRYELLDCVWWTRCEEFCNQHLDACTYVDPACEASCRADEYGTDYLDRFECAAAAFTCSEIRDCHGF